MEKKKQCKKVMEFPLKKQCKKCKDIYKYESVGMAFDTPRHSICVFCR